MSPAPGRAPCDTQFPLLIQAVRTFTRELSPEALDEGGPIEEPRAVSGAGKPDTAVPPTAQDVAPEERLGRDKMTELMVKRAQQNLPNLGIERRCAHQDHQLRA